MPGPQKIRSDNNQSSHSRNNERPSRRACICTVWARAPFPSARAEDQREPDFSEPILSMDSLRARCLHRRSIHHEVHGSFISVERRALRNASAFGGALLRGDKERLHYEELRKECFGVYGSYRALRRGVRGGFACIHQSPSAAARAN